MIACDICQDEVKSTKDGWIIELPNFEGKVIEYIFCDECAAGVREYIEQAYRNLNK